MKKEGSCRGKAEKDRRAPQKKEEKGEQHQCKQKDKEKKQLAEGHAKKQTFRKQLREEATANSVCRKLPMQDQLANEEEEQGTNTLDSTSHPKQCHGQLPARFQDFDSKESDGGVLCTICSQKEPPGCQAEVVFWIDCENCDAWAPVHTQCAFSSNTISCRYVCTYVTLVPPHIKFFQLYTSLLYSPV